MSRKPNLTPDKSNVYFFKPGLKGDVVEPQDEAKIVETNIDLVKTLMPSFDEFEIDKIAYMQAIWVEVAGIVNKAGFLSEITVLAVREIIPIYYYYRTGNAKILTDGTTYIAYGRNGKQVKAHALIGATTAWKKEINSFIGDFGLTPVSKKRLEDVAEQGDLFREFEGNGQFKS